MGWSRHDLAKEKFGTSHSRDDERSKDPDPNRVERENLIVPQRGEFQGSYDMQSRK